MQRNLQLDRATLASALADHVATLLREAITERGSASLVVPGGSTPKPLFEALRGHELDWSRVTVVPTDERWVPPEHEASNEGLIRRELLQGSASAATFVPLKSEGEAPEDGACREMREELGLNLAPGDLQLVLASINQRSDFAVLDVLFEAAMPDQEPRAASDAASYGWFPIDDLPADLAFTATRRALERWRADRRDR